VPEFKIFNYNYFSHVLSHLGVQQVEAALHRAWPFLVCSGPVDDVLPGLV